MACVSGTNIVNNGLVFHYDINNVQKSFKGKPVINLMGSDYNATNTSHPNNRPFSGVPHSNTNSITFEVNPPFSGLEVYKVTDNGTDTQNARYSIKVDCTNSWISYDTQYIWSMYIWLPSEFSSLYNRSNPFTSAVYQNTSSADWHGTRGYNATYDFYGAGDIKVNSANGSNHSGIDFNKLDQWQRIWVSFKPLLANVQLPENNGNDNNRWIAGYMRTNLTVTDTAYYFYLSGGQLEQSDQVTPFALNQRTNNQALLDLKGNTLTAANLTYGQDGIPTFDGADDHLYVEHNSIGHPTTSYTSEAWIKADSLQSNLYPRIWDKTSILLHITQTSPFTVALNTSTSAGLRQVAVGSAFSHSVWTHITTTYDGQYGKIFINGSLVVTNNFGSVLNPNSSTNNLSIGGIQNDTTRTFKGEINQVRLYWNKVLTSAEVKQNFEAMRARYGI